jgi:hypothetical protein
VKDAEVAEGAGLFELDRAGFAVLIGPLSKQSLIVTAADPLLSSGGELEELGSALPRQPTRRSADRETSRPMVFMPADTGRRRGWVTSSTPAATFDPVGQDLA